MLGCYKNVFCSETSNEINNMESLQCIFTLLGLSFTFFDTVSCCHEAVWHDDWTVLSSGISVLLRV